MRKLCLFALLLASVLCLTSCSEKAATRTVLAMDTVMTLTAYGPSAEDALDLAEDRIAELDALLGAETEGSDVYRINEAAGGATEVDAVTAGLIAKSLEISESCGGAFDISVCPASRAWGFVGGYENRVPYQAELDALKDIVGYGGIAVNGCEVSIENGMAITLGAIAKGYTSQALAELLCENGVESAVLSLGGNVQAIGAKPDGSEWKVGIQSPDDPDALAVHVGIKNCALVTSGGYQRNFTSDGALYHHILDPKTCAPAESGLKSVSIICDDGTTADALSTALFVLGADEAIEYWRRNGGFEAILITDDNRVVATGGIAESIYYTNDMYKLHIVN